VTEKENEGSSCVVQSVGCVQGRRVSGVSASASVAIFMCVMISETSGNIAVQSLGSKCGQRNMQEAQKAKIWICLCEIKKNQSIQMYRMFCTHFREHPV
jgi:hypothetical protein